VTRGRVRVNESGPSASADDSFFLEIDYDVGRWLRVARGESKRRVKRWARNAAAAWARDYGRADDAGWVEILRLMLVMMSEQPYQQEPDAVLAHVLTPPGQAPDPQLVGLMTVPADDTVAGLVDQLVEADAPETVERPTAEWVELSTGAPAAVVVSHLRAADGAIQTDLRVIWQLHEYVIATLIASSEDIGRVLLTRDDLITLAGTVHIHTVTGEAAP
jgi:hypothetical protein